MRGPITRASPKVYVTGPPTSGARKREGEESHSKTQIRFAAFELSPLRAAHKGGALPRPAFICRLLQTQGSAVPGRDARPSPDVLRRVLQRRRTLGARGRRAAL